MNETTGGVHSELAEQSKKHTVHENKAWGSGLFNNQGQKVDGSNYTNDGRENDDNSKGKQSFACFFKDNRALVTLLLRMLIIARENSHCAFEEAKSQPKKDFGKGVVMEHID